VRLVEDDSERRQQPLELILARNLVSIVSLAALLVGVEGRIVFYYDSAAKLVGRSFEEMGAMTREEWDAKHGPLDEHGAPLAAEQLPLTVAVREGRPAYGRFQIRAERGLLEVEAGALPLLGPSGYHRAMVFFWVASEVADSRSRGKANARRDANGS
jgi:PAS domain-containing protein